METASMANRHDDPIGYQVEDWRARARLAQAEARTLITRAEIWEDAAGRLEDAIAAEKKRQGCMRSHPHENMNAECERLTEVARSSSSATEPNT